MILDAPEHKDDAGNNSKGEGVGEVSEQNKISLMRENSHCMDQKILVKGELRLVPSQPQCPSGCNQCRENPP